MRQTILAVACAVLGFAATGQAVCRNEGCEAVKKILAHRGSGFVALRGAVLSRQSNHRPNEYAGKVKLPGAHRCTVEVVGPTYLYFCLFQSQPYSKMIAQFHRISADVKAAIPANWVTWENSGPGRKGAGGPAEAFRAGPTRGTPVVEIVTLMPPNKPPHLAVVIHQGGTAAPVAH